MAVRTIRSCRASDAAIPDSSAVHRRDDPSTSMKRNVTVPVGLATSRGS